MTITPPTRPRLDQATLHRRLAARWPEAAARLLVLVGIRGYYRDTMGLPDVNDYGIYDDAIFVLGPELFAAFNANTDPGRKGFNEGIGKPFATLKPGLYSYRLGLHRGKPGLVQASTVTVIRDDGVHPAWEETGFFGINIHRGARGSTSSEGCQTIPTDQWDAFITLVSIESRRRSLKEFHYALLEET